MDAPEWLVGGVPAPPATPAGPEPSAEDDPAVALWQGRTAGPSDESRRAVLASPSCALYYAVDVDQGPRDDTREAAARDPEAALNYAEMVDQGPHPVTRAGACRDPFRAADYAIHVDREPSPETFEAAQFHPEAARRYREWELRRKR